MDDRQIVELYFNRDEKAIEETSAKYGKNCFHIANNILNDWQDSEECVNDTYMTVWKTIPPTKPECLYAYVSKIVRNLSLKKLEYKMAEKRSWFTTVPFEELDEVLPDHRINPQYDTEKIGEKISGFLRSEKEEARNVFIRRYFYFDSIKSISKRYSFSESKVKNMLYHTRKRLKKELKKEGVEI